jgi:D-alanyl-D-alanine carboxypeptidase/D-alanyl-D-alanine carboxypeptidase (penicillin-binding protein 5/6)
MKKFISVILVFCFVVCVCSVKTEALSAKSAVVISGDTGEIIYSYNCNQRLSMASTTKIMTGLILCERGNLDREIVVTREMVAVEGSSMGLRAGDTVTLRNLLYGLMLPSGNDAANAIAITLGGSIENFAFMMNKRAKEMGLTNTHFATPSGLDADSHYTTAYELSIITKHALNNAEFAKVAATNSIVLTYGGTDHYLSNHNRLLSSIYNLLTKQIVHVKSSRYGRSCTTRRNDKLNIIFLKQLKYRLPNIYVFCCTKRIVDKYSL